MRINPIQTPRSNLHPLENQEDKEKPTAQESQSASSDSDKVTLSPEITKTRQYTTLATSEQIENMDIDERRRALIAQRIASGFYGQPEIEQETAAKIAGFPAR